MGHGIAQEYAMAGYFVKLFDIDERALDGAKDRIEDNLEQMVAFRLVDPEEVRSVRDRIATLSHLPDAAGEADLIVEAVKEDLEVKRALYRELDALAPSRAILASNTSTLMPSLLASATSRPEKVLVTHYFNPPYLLPLVEVVPHPGTSRETVDTAIGMLTHLGKSPALLKREVPGFIGNRLQIALLREALALVEDGTATVEDVDTVIRNSFGRRWAGGGIFEAWDLAGWDVVAQVAENLLPEISASQTLSPVLREIVERGDYGTKTGRGFYSYTPESADALRQRIQKILVAIQREVSAQGEKIR